MERTDAHTPPSDSLPLLNPDLSPPEAAPSLDELSTRVTLAEAEIESLTRRIGDVAAAVRKNTAQDSTPAWTDDQIEALAQYMHEECEEYKNIYAYKDNVKCWTDVARAAVDFMRAAPPEGEATKWTDMGVTWAIENGIVRNVEKEALILAIMRAGFSIAGNGTEISLVKVEGKDTAPIASPDVPEWMPSAQDLREAFADYADSCARGESDGKLSPTDFALKYLTPWLREPTGWTIDRPEHGWLSKGFCVMDPATGEQHDVEGLVDHIVSRIRPTFGPCKECEKKEAELLLYNNKRTPAQEEKEMGLNPYDQNVTIAMMEEELAMKQAEDTLVAELRERWDRAFFVALTVTTARYLPANRLQAAIIDAADLANETIRRHADMMAARDAVIAEVVG